MRSRRYKLALLSAMGCLFVGLTIRPVPAAASGPYESYNYSYWKEAVPSPSAYRPMSLIDGAALGIGAFKQPGDLAVGKDGFVYVLDSGNNRVVVLDSQFKYVRQIAGFRNDGKEDAFKNPQGLFVTKQGHLYVADTDNRRLVELSESGGFIRQIGAPKSDILRADFQYIPIKVVLDKANRIFVIGRGVTDGIMEFDADGNFSSFMGAPRVTFNPADYFWKNVSTKTQRDKMIQFVPTEFNNLDVDSSGFLYATTQTESVDPIQRLNPTGINVLKKNGFIPPIGDIIHLREEGTKFIDVAAAESGIYSAIDTEKGRIFTYDEEGNLLYIFGQLGSQAGTFRSPASIAYAGSSLLVLDRDQAMITAFAQTPFGAAVNQAIASHDAGKEDQALQAWKQVQRYDGNYELAYAGIGKSLLRKGDYKEAMRYFKLGNDRKDYSKAFAFERKRVTRVYFAPVMSILLALALLAWLGPKAWRRLSKGGVPIRG